MVKEEFRKAYSVMIGVRNLWRMGNSFVETISQLMKDQNNIDAINLLATQATELLSKSIIASSICLHYPLKDEECLKLLIDNEFRKLNHHLDKILQVPEIKNLLNIQDVTVSHNGLVNEYQITIVGSDEILLFKTLEAARYGFFSARKDVVRNLQPEGIGEFLKELSDKAADKIKTVEEFLMGYNK